MSITFSSFLPPPLSFRADLLPLSPLPPPYLDPLPVRDSYLHAWTLERENAQRRGYSFLGPHNRMFWLHAVLAGVVGFVWVEWGVWGVAFFVAQSVWAFTLLEITNYLEHYGLVRAREENGEHESVEIRHSWESRERVASYLLVRLQRHPDHHRFGKVRLLRGASPYP